MQHTLSIASGSVLIVAASALLLCFTTTTEASPIAKPGILYELDKLTADMEEGQQVSRKVEHH